MVKACLRYLKYILRHKWYVFLECCRLGIPWLGIIHDWGKFSLQEFIPHIRVYYDDEGRLIQSYTGDERLDSAWLLHQRRHKHHWQWWVCIGKNGQIKAMEMPDKYRREMLADWKGAGVVQGTPSTSAWYKEHKHEMRLHPNTRLWIESQLGIL